MKTTIDAAGRVVIPKEMRTALRLAGGEEVELTLAGEHIELTPPMRQARLRPDRNGVLTSDLDVPDHGPEQVRAALERSRR